MLKRQNIVHTAEEDHALLLFFAEVSRTATAPLRISTKELARQYYEKLGGTLQCSAKAIRMRIADYRNGLPGSLKNDKLISKDDKRKIVIALGLPKRKKRPWSPWTVEEDLKLVLFLAEQSRTATSPLHTYELSNLYLNTVVETQRAVPAIVTRIRSIRYNIPDILDEYELPNDDKEKMMFALGQPFQTTEQQFLNEIKPQIFEFLEGKSRHDYYSVDRNLAEEFRETYNIENLGDHIYVKVKNMIYRHADYDTFTKVKMMYISDSTVTAEILKELKQDATVRLTDQGKISYYLPHDKSFCLERNFKRPRARNDLALSKEKKVQKSKKPRTQILETDLGADEMLAEKTPSLTRSHGDSFSDSGSSTPRSTFSGRTNQDALAVRDVATKRKTGGQTMSSDSGEVGSVPRPSEGRSRSPSFDVGYPARRVSTPFHHSPAPLISTVPIYPPQSPFALNEAQQATPLSAGMRNVPPPTADLTPATPFNEDLQQAQSVGQGQAQSQLIPSLAHPAAQSPVRNFLGSQDALLPHGPSQHVHQARLGTPHFVQPSVQHQVQNQPQQPRQASTLVLPQIHEHEKATAPTSSGSATQVAPPTPARTPSNLLCQGLQQAEPVGQDQAQAQLQSQSSTQQAAQRQGPGQASLKTVLGSQNVRPIKRPPQPFPPAQLATAQVIQPEASPSVQRQVQNQASPQQPSQASTSAQVLDKDLPGTQTQQQAGHQPNQPVDQAVKKPESARRRGQQQNQLQQSLPDQSRVEGPVRIKEELEGEERAPQRFSQAPTHASFLEKYHCFVTTLELDCLDETLYKISKVIKAMSNKSSRSEVAIEPVLQSLSLAIFIVAKDRGLKRENDVASMSVKAFLWALKYMLNALRDSSFDGVKEQLGEALKKVGEQDKMCPADTICTVVKMIWEAAKPNGF